MRNIAGLEEKSHSEKTRAGYRLARGGRMKKMKMEPREGYQSAETAQLLAYMNEAAGAGVEPTSAAMDTGHGVSRLGVTSNAHRTLEARGPADLCVSGFCGVYGCVSVL